MHVRSLLLSATLTLGLAAGVNAKGPPWISIELPANPHHPATRDATMLVRAYHHSTLLKAPVTGIAEGIVDGKRVSLPLELRATHEPGVFAVRTPLPRDGTWIMAFTVAESEESTATALVTVDPRGRIVAVDVPSRRSRDGWMVPQPVSKRDIEAALNAAVVAYDASNDRTPYGFAFALPLLLVGTVAVAGIRSRTGQRAEAR